MIGAQHRLLAHTTSNELAAIRSVELQYFLDFFNAVGLQCAFMGAYQISLLSQTPVTYNNFNYYVVCLTYWITGVLGIILGFFGLLMSM